MKKNIIIFAVMFLAFAALGYAQDLAQGPNMNTIKGSIAQIDWVAGKIVVRTYDFDNNLDEITFVVTEDTKITKDTETVFLSDLHQSDTVNVTYATVGNSFEGLQAASINVVN